VILSDRSIREEIKKGRLVIDPLDPNAIQPSSVDLRLGRKCRIFKARTRVPVIDPKIKTDDLTELIEINELEPLVIHPGEFLLATTLEKVCVPRDLVGRLDGKSSLGRLGLLVHSTAGYVDPGWRGHLTLELTNVSNLPIMLYYGMPVSQISFSRLTEPAENPYGSKKLASKYQDQDEPMPSQYYRNFPQGKPRKR
jgi:dCTP deaminase